jgi:hypothetical protein
MRGSYFTDLKMMLEVRKGEKNNYLRWASTRLPIKWCYYPNSKMLGYVLQGLFSFLLEQTCKCQLIPPMAREALCIHNVRQICDL